MQAGPEAPETLHFGVFEVNLQSGELLKRGRKVHLQDQPFRLLALLLSRPGELVTRDELQRALWPADTFVEFERGVNTAVKKVRRALGDSAENPRFIETLPRRGYRFIAPVSPVDLRRADSVAAGLTPDRTGVRLWREHWLWIGAGTLIALSAAVWWLALRPGSRPASQSEFRLVQLTRDSGFTCCPTISGDGKLVAYASDRDGGNMDVWVQQLDGGSAVRLTDHEAADHSPDFSPDGSKIVFVSGRNGRGIFIMPSLGGEPRLLAQDGENPRFSPDGTQIAYVRGIQGSFEGAGIYVISSQGGTPRQFLPDFIAAALPIWAPDSKHLAFLGVHPKEGFDLWVGSLDGRAVRTGAVDIFKKQRVGFSGLEAWDPTWNFLLLAGASGDSVNIWRLPISPKTWQVKGPVERVTFGVGERYARIGPRGRVVFSTFGGQADIWSLPVVANRGTVAGKLERLTTNGAAGCDISPDGRLLVFRAIQSGSNQIWIKDLRTGKEMALTDNPGPKGMPKIARDGSKVSFSHLNEKGVATYVVPAGGGLPEIVCADCGGPSSWSPDGERFVHHHTDGGLSRIFLTDMQTRQRRLLAEDPKLPLYVPRFSADGRWIAFKCDLDVRRTVLWVAPFGMDVPIPRKEWIPVTAGKAWDDLPQWSPNGRLLYFTSDRDGYRCIWARRLNGTTKKPEGAPFPVRHFHDLQLSMSVLGLSQLELGLAKDRLVFPLAEVRGNIWMMEPSTP